MHRLVHACCSSLGLVAALAAQSPDLLVGSIDRSAVIGDWQNLTISGTATAQVCNVGTATAQGPFDVLFFEDTVRNDRYDPGLDRVFGTATVASLAAGAKTTATAAVAGPVRFRDDLLYALVDSSGQVAELDETNNQWDTGRQCQVTPSGSLMPVLEWSWTSSSRQPAALNVMMTPGVVDLDGDGVPDVVFASTASTGGGLVEVGYLRALSGANGTELFTVDDPSLLVNTASSVAVGDIDGDGKPEVVACDSSGARLIAFEHDGSFKWRSGTLEAIDWGAPALADLDGDGAPEIVMGRQVLDNAGNLLWTGTGGRGGQVSPLPTVADVDLDGSPDIVAGNTVYSATGQIQASAALADGYPGVANFDADPQAEIVVVSNGVVYLREHDLSPIWQATIPGGGGGGPPTIADYDNDGQPEIGVAGASRYTVWDTDGSQLWSQPTQDGSSNVTGSSVFDFEGDGSAEVVYRDELKLRIYRGTDGTVLFEVPMSSCTWHEYVLVADVDADGNAEIVAVANNNCGFGPQRGVFVYGAARDNWVATRPVWNQHTYHITNVNDDGTIPAIESNNWLSPPSAPLNDFRQNVLTTAAPTSAPDLTSSFLSPPTTGCAAITGRIGNGGGIFAPAGIPVSFYDGDPSGGALLATVPTATQLKPGDFEDVSWPVPAGTTLFGPLYVVADDTGGLNGTQSECDETNNQHSAALCARASFTGYGAGWPGERGIPALDLGAAPVLGTTIDIRIGNSQSAATCACLLVGMQRTDQATAFGGRLLVDHQVTIPLAIVPGTNVYPVTLPCETARHCGERYDLQAVELDAAASHGVSFSAGLELVLGQQ